MLSLRCGEDLIEHVCMCSTAACLSDNTKEATLRENETLPDLAVYPRLVVEDYHLDLLRLA